MSSKFGRRYWKRKGASTATDSFGILSGPITVQQLSECIRNLLKANGTYKSLIHLCAVAAIPSNQWAEDRFFHLTQLILSSAEVFRSGNSNCWKAVASVVKSHEREFGHSFSSEGDFGPIPFLSWVRFEDLYYKVPTGTFEWSELLLQDVIDKLVALDDEVERHINSSCTDILGFFLPRIDAFLKSSGLYGADFLSTSGTQRGNGYSVEPEKVRTAFEQHLCIRRSDLPETLKEVFSLLSSKVPKDFDHREPATISDLHSMVLVEFRDYFVVPYPALFLPSLLRRITTIIGWSKNESAKMQMANELFYRLIAVLRWRFGADKVFSMPKTQGKFLADVLILFDRKAILVNLKVETERLITPVELNDHDSIAQWLEAAADDKVTINCLDETVQIQGAQTFEPMLITIVDGILSEPSIGFRENVPTLEFAQVELPMTALEFIAKDCLDAMELVKFIRSVQKFHSGQSLIIGSDILDLWSRYKHTGGLAPPLVPGRFTAVVLESHSFSEYHFAKLVDFRKTHALVAGSLGNTLYKRRYPNVLQLKRSDGMVYWLIESSGLTIRVSSRKPKLAAEGELAHSLYHTWRVATDSFCYHLGKRAEILSRQLSGVELGAIDKILIQVSGDDSISRTHCSAVIEKRSIIISLQFSADLQPAFMAGDNSGELELFNSCVSSIAELFPNLNLAPLVIKPEAFSRFKILIAPVSHVSMLDVLSISPIYLADKWSVSLIEADSLTANGVIEGEYAENQILDILHYPLKALHSELESRVAALDSDSLIEWCYLQLEASHIFFESEKMNVTANLHTAEFSDPSAELLELTTNSAEYNFALRLLLETTAKGRSDSSSKYNLEEVHALLAICQRIIQLDSLGDYVYLLGKQRQEPIRLKISEWGCASLDGNFELVELPKMQIMKEQVSYLNSITRAPLADGGNSDATFRDRLTAHFKEGFFDEFGYSLEDRLLVHEGLVMIFDETREPIARLSAEELGAALSSHTGLVRSSIQLVLKDLTLDAGSLDSKYLSPSLNYWRDGRLLNRPLVILRGADQFIFSRSVVDWAYKIFAGRVVAARHDDKKVKSKLLKAAYGAWSLGEGEEFRIEVCRTFADYGFENYPEVTAVNNKAIPSEHVGPIDIIVVDRFAKKILVVECKRSSFSRNLKDLKTEFEKYYGAKNEIGYVQRILNKTNWIANNIAYLGIEYGINDIGLWEIEAVLVSSEYLWCLDAKPPAGLSVYTHQGLKDCLASRSCKPSIDELSGNG